MKKLKYLLLLTWFIPLLSAKATITNSTIVNVSDINSLETCLQTTNNVCTLSNDITITKKIQIQNVDVEINLNNHNINYDETLTLDPLFNVKNASVNLTGEGTITNNRRLFYLDGNTKIGDNPIKAELTVGKDVKMISTEFVNVFIRGEGSKLDVYGTLEVHGGQYAVIQGNGSVDSKTDCGNTVVNIYNGAKVINTGNGLGIYHPQSGTLSINGGTIQSNYTAIEMRAGDLVIKGGEIISNAETFTYTPNDSGPTVDGVAIAISQHTTKLPININISGGTIKGPLSVYKIASKNESDDAKIKLNISGGKFLSTKGKESIIVEKTTGFISGGEFSENLIEDSVKKEYLVNEIEWAYKPSTDTYVFGKNHNITVNQPKNGTIKINKTKAIAGEVIELTITPNEGYKISGVGAIYNNGASDFIIENNTFEMVNSDVIVEATFELETTNPPTGDNILVSIITLIISGLSIILIKNKVKAY